MVVPTKSMNCSSTFVIIYLPLNIHTNTYLYLQYIDLVNNTKVLSNKMNDNIIGFPVAIHIPDKESSK